MMLPSTHCVLITLFLSLTVWFEYAHANTMKWEWIEVTSKPPGSGSRCGAMAASDAVLSSSDPDSSSYYSSHFSSPSAPSSSSTSSSSTGIGPTFVTMGGLTEDQDILADIQVYDNSTGSWHGGPSLTVGRAFGYSVVLPSDGGDTLVAVFGGVTFVNKTQSPTLMDAVLSVATNSLYVSSTLSSTTVSSTNATNTNSSSGGGPHDDDDEFPPFTVTNVMEVFLLLSESVYTLPAPSITPSPRAGFAGTSVSGGVFYIHGGFDSSVLMGDLWEYTPGVTQSWRRVSDGVGSPVGLRAFHSMVALSESSELFVYGGLVPGTVGATTGPLLYRCSATIGVWSLVHADSSPSGLGFSLVSFGARGLFLYGGLELSEDVGGSELPVSTVLRLDTEVEAPSWAALQMVNSEKSVPPGRWGHVAAVAPGFMFVVGGNQGAFLTSNECDLDIWVLRPYAERFSFVGLATILTFLLVCCCMSCCFCIVVGTLVARNRSSRGRVGPVPGSLHPHDHPGGSSYPGRRIHGGGGGGAPVVATYVNGPPAPMGEPWVATPPPPYSAVNYVSQPFPLAQQQGQQADLAAAVGSQESGGSNQGLPPGLASPQAAPPVGGAPLATTPSFAPSFSHQEGGGPSSSATVGGEAPSPVSTYAY